MKKMMKEVRPARTRSYLKQKLISAGAMLLVSAIMMVSTSYAWYVLSTAPEVANIKTQVGANGALEIALLDKNSWANLNLLDMGDIDESLPDQSQVAATVANLTWGNLVNLGDASYGLDKIVLQPSRLYIEKDGTGHKVNVVPLKTPIYGEDGRVKGLDKTSAVAYTYANGTFSDASGYGVRAIGTAASMSVFQLGMNAARSSLVTYAASARTAASNSLQATGGALANVVVAYAISNQTSGYKNSDVAQVKALATGLDSALTEIETALRYVFAGYITTSDAVYDEENNPDGTITNDNYQAKLAEITGGTKTLAELLTMYPGISDTVEDIGDYISTVSANQTQMDAAIAACGALTDDDHTWDEISSIIMPLMNTGKMLVNGKTIDTLKSELRNEDGSINTDSAMGLVSGGITITVPSGSGILSDIADFADDYTAVVSVYPKMTIGSMVLDGSVGMDVMMTTATEAKPVYLTASSNGLKAATVANASGSNSITDYYGYALDLAFRTNAEESNLLLQTEPQNRIYDGNTQNTALQGAGSYMSFTTSAGLSATKMVKLMSGIRVVLAEPNSDGTMKILAIAALDTTLGKNVYKAETDKDGNPTGKYYLDGSAGAYQNSDLIDSTAYNALPETSAVTFNKTTGKVTAKLYIYSFEMAKRNLTKEDGTPDLDEEGKQKFAYTGALTIKEKVDGGVITALTQDVVQKMTALVYLDGSVVNNSTVAANSAQSMAGTLNLQFSSSATLIPAENTKLQSTVTEVTYTELADNELYSAGYLFYNGVFGKITNGYKIYTGSDDKIYFANETSEYTELTAENALTVLTPVTVKLTNASTGAEIGSTLEMVKGEVITFNAALNISDDENLRISSGTSTASDSKAEIVVDQAALTGTITAKETGVSSGLSASLTVSVKRADGSISTTGYSIKSQSITITVTETATDPDDAT